MGDITHRRWYLQQQDDFTLNRDCVGNAFPEGYVSILSIYFNILLLEPNKSEDNPK